MIEERMFEWTRQIQETGRKNPGSMRDVLRRIVSEADSDNLLNEAYLFRLTLLTLLFKSGQLEEASTIVDEMQLIERQVSVSEDSKMRAAHLFERVRVFTGASSEKEAVLALLSRHTSSIEDAARLFVQLSRIYAVEDQHELALQAWLCHVKTTLIASFICRMSQNLEQGLGITFESPPWLIPSFQTSSKESKNAIVECTLDICASIDSNQNMIHLTTQSIPFLEAIEQWLQQQKKRRQAEKLQQLIELIKQKYDYWDSRRRLLALEDEEPKNDDSIQST